MKPILKSLILAGLVVMCLSVMPAISMPMGDDTPKAQCNVYASEIKKEMRPMGAPEIGHPGMGPMGMINDENKSWNESQTIEIRQKGRGFALNDNQYHILAMNIIGEMTLNLSDLEKLVKDNKTLGQIKSDIKEEINAKMSAASCNGTLRLGESEYNLVNIKLISSNDNSTTIEADVSEPDIAATAGHITITSALHEGSIVGEGTLNMSSGKNSDKYKVLLEMGHEWGGHDFHRAYGFSGMDGNGEKYGIHQCHRPGTDMGEKGQKV